MYFTSLLSSPSCDLDVRFVDAPGVCGRFQVRPASGFEFGRIPLNPTKDRGVIDRESPLLHHLFQVSVAEGISQIPADAKQDDVGLEVMPFEGTPGLHATGSSR